MTEKSSVFKTLNDINVNEKIEEKNGLKYLSWAYAWGILKEYYPDSSFRIYENEKGWNYHTDGKTAWVKTGVTVAGVEYIEYLPVMNYSNRSIPIENVTSMDVTKAIQRAITKAIGRHGLGLYIYAGEDLPNQKNADATEYSKEAESKPEAVYTCSNCGGAVKGFKRTSGEIVSAAETYSQTGGLCIKCFNADKKERGVNK